MNRSTASLLRFICPLMAVVAAYLVRIAVERTFGPGLPTYVTYFPVIMLTSVIMGLGPGLVATATAAVVAYFLQLTPHGSLVIASASEAIGLAIFISTGICMSLVAAYYLRLRTRLNEMVSERTASLTRVNEQLKEEYAQRQQAEESLAAVREKNRYLAELLEASEQPFAVAYPDGSIGYFNGAFEMLTGYSREELETIDWAIGLTPAEWSCVERTMLAELDRSGHAVRYEKEYTRKDGSRVPVELLVHLMRDEQGAPACYYSFLTDLTPRKSAEKALHEANEELLSANAELHQQTQELAYYNDELKRAEERITLLAKTAERLLVADSPREEVEALCNKALSALDCHVFFNYLTEPASGRLHLNAATGIPQEEKERIAWLDYGLAVCGCSAQDACRIVAEDIPNSADERTELVRAYGIKAYACHPLTIAGEVLGTLSFGTRSRSAFSEEDLELMKAIADLVAIAIERNRTREKIEMAHAMLEKQVMERTDDLREAIISLEREMNERLQAVEELRRRERLLSQQSRLAAMGEMISNIAHQWRQPLNTLGLLIQQLPVFYGSDVFTREFLVKSTTDAMKLIQHMSSTIDDFRDFFRPEKEQTLFSIEKAIHQAVSLVDVSFRNQNLSVDVRTEGNPVVTGFPNEFSQVIMNIILNARDALIEKGVESGIIRIRAGLMDGRVYVTISDNAGGIPEDIVDRIFEPYFTTKGPDRGTGIGLFMAKTIIEQNHGGQLTVRNFQGGAEFRIEI